MTGKVCSDIWAKCMEYLSQWYGGQCMKWSTEGFWYPVLQNCFAAQGISVQSWVWEDPRLWSSYKPVPTTPEACAPELTPPQERHWFGWEAVPPRAAPARHSQSPRLLRPAPRQPLPTLTAGRGKLRPVLCGLRFAWLKVNPPRAIHTAHSSLVSASFA